MRTRLLPLNELKQVFIELFLNKTDKVSDISDDSVVSATAYGCSKTAQKCIKDIAVLEAQVFPQYAVGTDLDASADLFGVSERRGAVGSSTYIKVVADPSTQYLQSTHTFKNNNGITFELEEDFTMGSDGYGYARIRSTGTGVNTNVDANSIITVTPVPTGHIACSNEYMASGGIDSESDEVYRNRILNNRSVYARYTPEYVNQIMQYLDDRILKTFNSGRDEDGKTIISIVLQNGASLTQNELDTLLEQFTPYLSITDINKFGDAIGVVLQNAEWEEFDMDFRVSISSAYNTDDVRKNIQIAVSKAFDFRFWESGSKIEWDNIFDAVKNVEGVNYVPDENFFPNEDISVPYGKLPRLRAFVMRDIRGTVIYDNGGSLTPIFYPNE